MLGFIKLKENRKLGGEIFHERQRVKKIYFSILGVIMFVLLNVILYYLTKF
jgi:predicted nucleic acid-binding Zn ribbon protein